MDSDVLTAARGSTHAIIKTEDGVCIPEYHKNVTGLLKHINKQIAALHDPSLTLNDCLKSKLNWRKSWVSCQRSLLRLLFLY